MIVATALLDGLEAGVVDLRSDLVAGRFLIGGTAIAVAVIKRRKVARATRALQRLDDRELKDIGLTRSQIESAAFGAPDCYADRRATWWR